MHRNSSDRPSHPLYTQFSTPSTRQHTPLHINTQRQFYIHNNGSLFPSAQATLQSGLQKQIRWLVKRQLVRLARVDKGGVSLDHRPHLPRWETNHKNKAWRRQNKVSPAFRKKAPDH